jgi:glycerol uptake facilitator protein
MSGAPWLKASAAECVGTFILVFFGVGSVHVAVLTGALVGLGQVAAVWGVGIALAIYATGAISGAHLNPAITLAFAAFRQFPPSRILPYITSQFLGALAGAAVLYLLFGGCIADFEATHGLVRGGPGSEQSAMMYGEYFPNPSMAQGGTSMLGGITMAGAMAAEAIGTAMLAFFVFALTDRRNSGRPSGTTAALLIGLTVAIIIAIVAPLTQAGLNPARDFAPRLFAYLAGWGPVAIPGPRGGFFLVYILAPILGAIVGAAAYEFIVRPGLAKEDTTSDKLSGDQA